MFVVPNNKTIKNEVKCAWRFTQPTGIMSCWRGCCCCRCRCHRRRSVPTDGWPRRIARGASAFHPAGSASWFPPFPAGIPSRLAWCASRCCCSIRHHSNNNNNTTRQPNFQFREKEEKQLSVNASINVSNDRTRHRKWADTGSRVNLKSSTYSETLVCCSESLRFLMTARFNSMSRWMRAKRRSICWRSLDVAQLVPLVTPVGCCCCCSTVVIVAPCCSRCCCRLHSTRWINATIIQNDQLYYHRKPVSCWRESGQWQLLSTATANQMEITIAQKRKTRQRNEPMRLIGRA